MVLETGDYFVITRGVKLRNMNSGIFSLFGDGESWKQSETEEEHYDRSFHDCVFLAKAVESPMVVAERIWPLGNRNVYLPHVMSINLTEIEIMTVGKNYVEALKGE